ncbi:MAG: hypothetical protein WBX15_00090 [Thermoanaerobaculia bacterium]
MKYSLFLKSRPDERESVRDKHAKLVKESESAPSEWRISPDASSKLPPFRDSLLTTMDLRPYLEGPYKGRVGYVFREGLSDTGADDDFLNLEFDSEKVDFNEIVKRVLPIYIEAFRAYRAQIGPDELIDVDFDDDDVDERHDIYRLHVVNYFDAELIRRAFQYPIEEIVDRLSRAKVEVIIIKKGLLIALARHAMRVDELLDANVRIRRFLGEWQR